MRANLLSLAEWHDETLAELCSPAGERAQSLIEGKLTPGARCAWCYEDDMTFWTEEKKKFKEPIPTPDKWPYRGFIIPFPDSDGRTKDMAIENVCVVCVDYPIEKENPETDWVTLARVLTTPNLHAFVVL